MISPDEIASIIDQYKKHGWALRRALISPDSATAASAVFEAGVEVRIAPNEALWFSRRSQPDREAWELRRLTGSPFALVAVLDDSLDDDERELLLSSTEERMFDGSHAEPTSH